MNETIKLTKQGLTELRKKLADLQKKYDENAKALTKAYKNSSGDGAHDNAEFEYLLNQEKMIVNEMNRLSSQIQTAIIVEQTEMGVDSVNINDTVALNMMLTPTTANEMTVQLIGGTVTEIGKQVSINSPLGKAIYGRKIGETVSYAVAQNKINVKILRKIPMQGKNNVQ